jgi:hypothetical protein
MAPSAQADKIQETRKTPLELLSQGKCLPGIPKHPTFAAQRQWLLEQMALAFRVFARKDYTDGLAGHISVRDPENPHTFWTVSRLTSGRPPPPPGGDETGINP